MALVANFKRQQIHGVVQRVKRSRAQPVACYKQPRLVIAVQRDIRYQVQPVANFKRQPIHGVAQRVKRSLAQPVACCKQPRLVITVQWDIRYLAQPVASFKRQQIHGVALLIMQITTMVRAAGIKLLRIRCHVPTQVTRQIRPLKYVRKY